MPTAQRDVHSPPDTAPLWRQYELDGDAEALLVRHWGLVRRIAGRMSGDLPPFVDRSDLVSYGIVGLADAIDKFDPDRAVPFETYAATRIRGAILDGLRSVDWVPRSVRAKLRALARAESALRTTLQRNPTEAEIAVAAGISVTGVRKLAGAAALCTVVRLDDVRPAAALNRADPRADHPGQALEAAERKQAVVTAIEGLDDRDRTVIDLYYYRELKLTEIGRVLGVTEARVSQLHTHARSALRETLLAMDL